MNRLNMLQFIYDARPLRHTLTRKRDYTLHPKDDGYRSIHYMYRFSGRGTSLPWHKLRVEIQMRTKLQHAWATAVETVDAFTGEDLKFGHGSKDWRRFFALVGSVHAVTEKTPTVPGTPTTHQSLVEEVRDLEQQLGVIHRLDSYAHITSRVTGPSPHQKDWYLIELLPDAKTVNVRGYPLSELKRAEKDLGQLEERYRNSRNQAVLVSASSLNELRRAYPNYFADTVHFTAVLRRFLEG